MAKGQHYSAYQKKIINNYYEHMDTITLQKLSEAVSDLYLCESAYQAEKIWDQVARTLEKTGVEAPRIARLRQDRNPEALARLVTELSSSPGPVVAKKPAPGFAPSPPPSEGGVGGGLSGQTSPTPGAVGSPQPPAPSPQPRSPSAPAPITPDILKSALKAFRKRLKLTKLDEESAVGRRPTTSGTKSDIVAITPPTQFPRAVWDELARQGKLKDAGRGFFELVE